MPGRKIGIYNLTCVLSALANRREVYLGPFSSRHYILAITVTVMGHKTFIYSLARSFVYSFIPSFNSP